MKRGVHLPLCTPTQSPADDTGQAVQAEGLWGPDPGAGQLATPVAELVTVSSHIGQLKFFWEKKIVRQPPVGRSSLGNPALQRAAEPPNHRLPCSAPGPH